MKGSQLQPHVYLESPPLKIPIPEKQGIQLCINRLTIDVLVRCSMADRVPQLSVGKRQGTLWTSQKWNSGPSLPR